MQQRGPSVGVWVVDLVLSLPPACTDQNPSATSEKEPNDIVVSDEILI